MPRSLTTLTRRGTSPVLIQCHATPKLTQMSLCFPTIQQGESVESLPKWNFDGSSTGQAPGDDSEVVLKPCRIFKDPFRVRSDGLDNILVMCDCYTPNGEPLPTNNRAKAMKSFGGNEDQEVWFGLEQEFTLFNLDERTPLGWPEGGMPNRPQGPYYCSVGPEVCTLLNKNVFRISSAFFSTRRNHLWFVAFP